MSTIGSGPKRATSILSAAFVAVLAHAALAAQAPAVAGDPAALEAGADRQTGVRGRVVERRSGKPLGNAPVLVQGGGKLRTTVTDENGVYRFFVPPGTYTVRSYFDLYHGARIAGAVVNRGELLDVDLQLLRIDEERDVSVEELEIPYRADTTTAAAQDQLRQASSGIGEGLGAKQMSQSGASDAGSAAARVVGVTIESSQLVIRGLGGRYTRVLLNGIPVPSVDPDVPGADLDMFPTGVIDSLSISKTFLPDIPADFAGGVMEIKSVSFPRKFTLEAGVASGFDSQATLRQRLDYRGGTLDNLGFDDGKRSIPAAVPSDRQLRSSGDPAHLDAARSFRNSLQYRRKQGMPKLGLDLTVGDSYKLGGQTRFGYLATAGYDYDSRRKVGISRSNPIIEGGQLIERNNFAIESGSDEVSWVGLGTASLDVGIDHSLSVLTLYNRAVTDETSLQVGRSGGEAVEKWQLQFLARTLWFNQVFGDHRNLFGTRLRLRWAGFHAYGDRDEPDRRTIGYGESGGTFEWLRSGSERFFSRLRQDDVGGSLSLRAPLWSEGWATLGGFVQRSSRAFNNRRFRLQKLQNHDDPTIYAKPVETIFAPENIGRASDINEETRNNDSYESSQLLWSGFALVETPLVGPLSLAGGVRTEVLTQEVESRSPFQAQATDRQRTDRTDVDYLPGAALKYQLGAKMVLRGAYGMTVARPQIRELAPYAYYDFLRDRSIEGNPALKRTRIHNVDLRWEWFFAEGQIVALSGFYKRFSDPIELAIIDNVGGGSQFRNGTSAQNLGAELETRINLGRFARGLRFFDLDGNLALVRSRIELPEDLRRTARGSRPLAGQAPFVANLSLRFFKDDEQASRSVTAALVYNVVGPRIADVATLLGNVIPPDIEEQAFHSLDLVGSVATGKHVKVKLRVRNLLLQRRELKQGDFLIQSIEPGISASLGLAVSY